VHVAIDLRATDAPGMEMTGVGRYALEVTRALRAARPRWRFSLFSNRADLIAGDASAELRRTRFPTRRAAARVAWLHTAAALAASRRRPDVWFSPSFVLPLWWRGPSVVTIHDLTFLLLRERYRGTANALYATAATRISARHADRVLCGSESTSALLVRHLGIDAAKVDVIPYGVSDTFFRAADTDATGGEGSARPYLLFVGTWEARKGIATLYEALGKLNASGARIRLVLAGAPGWGTEALLETVRRDACVELLERPGDSQLADLYSHALALVYPSEMEGFGLPVAEAMACGCPVIATDLPPIREFARSCPLYIGQGDSDGIVGHVETLLGGAVDLAAWRREASLTVSALRWEAVAERTAAAIESAFRARGARS
jgi:glycosyltransferase involved in cell wall biosynthesis